MDKVTAALLEALKQALAEPAEQRLFRSGKLPGLLPGRGGVNSEAATRAIRDGLLEVVRTEDKGKTVVEWVRLTPRGVDFLHEQESPARALDELRQALTSNQEQLPAWLAEVQQSVQHFLTGLTADVQRVMHRLDALARRAEETLRRLEDAVPPLPEGVEAEVPWVAEAIAYLERRRAANAPAECPLPELFAALAEQLPDLSITAFHDGLRRLRERRVVRLLPSAAAAELPQPEYALPDGAQLLYFLAR